MSIKVLRWGVLLLLGVSMMTYALIQMVYTPPIELSTQLPDIGLASKTKLVRLGNGMLIAPYGDAIEDDATRYVYDAKGDKLRPARDIFVRTCNSKTADCSVEANWSDAVNLSGTASQTSISTDWDGDIDADNTRKPYYGDSDKPNIFSAGSRVVVSWVDKYCPGGAQRTVTYITRENVEVPFSCMYETHSNNGGVTWSTPTQISSGERDAKSDVSRGNSAGRWVATWQEDPLGLQLGSADGPGDGASGAKVTGGTDIWYSYSTDLTTAADVGVWSAPIRLTDNYDGTMSASGNFDPVRDSAGILLDDADIEGGKGGAARANTALVGSTVIVAYEERKASGGLDIGKYVRYHDFVFNDVAGTNDPIGCIISNPQENGRRVRFVPQGSPGPNSGLRWAIFWKEGEFTEGGPSDIIARLGYTDFTSANLTPAVDAACNAPDFDAAEALVNAPGLNLSHDTENMGDLTATTDLNELEDSRAHRALLRGDDLYIGWSYTPDWALARFTELENYNFWFRHFRAAEDTWDMPVNLSNIDDKGINVKEPRLVGTPGSSGPGCPSGDPADATTTDTEDCKDSAVFYVAWGTETNVREQVGGAVDLDLFITRTTDKGQTFEPVQTLAGVVDEEFESQIRPTPAGNMLYAVWNQDGPSGTESEFTMGTATFIPEADVALTASASDTSVRNKKTFTVTLSVDNNGPDDATNVLVAGTLPATVSVVDAGSCTVAGLQVTCSVANLTSGSSATFDVSVKAESVGDAVFAASVVADEIEPDASNNDASVTVTIKRKSSGGGGCAYNPGGPIDPTLPLILLVGIAGLIYRNRKSCTTAG